MPALAAARPSKPRHDPRLEPIRAKVNRGERLTLDDGEVLYSTPDLYTVLELADLVRRRLHGTAAYYNVNRHLNYSNVCALSCKFCDFYAKKDDAKAYTRDTEYVRDEVRKAIEAGATEIHSVGGLHPYLPFSYYTDLVSTIRDEASKLGSDLHVKAFTAVEIVHLAKIAKVYKNDDRTAGIRWVLTKLKEAGLGSLPGGGAEVFDDRVHDEAYKGKIRSDVWLDVHRVAHEIGLNTNATILYGHIEQRAERLVHMDMLRRAQEVALARLGYQSTQSEKPQSEKNQLTPTMRSAESSRSFTPSASSSSRDPHPAITLTRPGTPLPEHIAFGVSPSARMPNAECRMPKSGTEEQRERGESVGSARRADVPGYFQTIIPLPFFPDGCELEHLPGPSGLENYRTLAVARLMLDNFPHVKAFWIMQTLPMAQVMLQSGADDLDGTVVWYDITKLNHGSGQGNAGDRVATHQEVNVWTLQKAIREAGFEPVERDTVYRRVVRDGAKWRVTT